MHIVTRWRYKCNKKDEKVCIKRTVRCIPVERTRKRRRNVHGAKSSRGKVNGEDGEVQRKTPIKRPPN